MSMSFSVARRTISGRPHYKVVASAKCGVCWHHSWKRVINSASIKLWQRAGLVLLPAYYLSTASRISFRAVPSDSICKHNLKFFPVAGKQQKSWPNSPVQHHSHIIQQALKPILERFDFVKSSRFSPVFAATMTRPKIRAKSGGPAATGKPRHPIYQGDRK